MRVSHLTLATPYQPGAISRTGKPWAGGQRRAVHLVAEQDVGVQGVRPRHAAGELLGRDRRIPRRPRVPHLLAGVGPPEDHLAAPVEQARLRSSGASGVPAQRRCRSPRWNEGNAVVAGALQREGDLLARAGAQVGEGERQRPRDQAADLQPPGRRGDRPAGRSWTIEELVGRREPGVELLPVQQLAGRPRRAPGWAGWSSQGRTSSPGRAGKARASPGDRSGASPASAAPPPRISARRARSRGSINRAPFVPAMALWSSIAMVPPWCAGRSTRRPPPTGRRGRRGSVAPQRWAIMKLRHAVTLAMRIPTSLAVVGRCATDAPQKPPCPDPQHPSLATGAKGPGNRRRLVFYPRAGLAASCEQGLPGKHAPARGPTGCRRGVL